jgi:hypothetical protein
VPVSHRNHFFKSPLNMAFPTAVDPADRAVGPLSPLPCRAWHGYGVSSAHHGELRECRRACERTPLRGRRRCAAGGRPTMVCMCNTTRFISFVVMEFGTCNEGHAMTALITEMAKHLVVSPMKRSMWENCWPTWAHINNIIPFVAHRTCKQLRNAWIALRTSVPSSTRPLLAASVVITRAIDRSPSSSPSPSIVACV